MTSTVNYQQYEKKFSDKARTGGYTPELLALCLGYAKVLYENNVPVIYNTSHLSQLVGYRYDYLKRAVGHTRFFYRKYEIVKKGGGHREINEPLPSLKEIQQWILINILRNVEVSRYAKAYSPKSCIKNHVKYHKQQKHVLVLDIQTFFDSIPSSLIQPIFQEKGYTGRLSSLLAKLCMLNEKLPQGAPTSPSLSNIVMKEFDEAIGVFCTEREIKYTRYADDMAFSGEFEPSGVIEFVKSKLDEMFSMKLNDKKTRFMPRNQPQLVTGVVVNSHPQVPRNTRMELRQAVYHIKTKGLEHHLKKKGITKANYINHLKGITNYILTLNPKDAKVMEYREILRSL